MKQYILALLLFGSLAASGQKNVQFKFGPDTLICSSSVDTVTRYLGGSTFATAYDFADFGALVVQVESDSLSGGTNGTLKIQFSNDGTTWYDAGSLTLNGSANQTLRVEDSEFTERKVRIYAIAPSSTQQTKIWGEVSFKRK